MGLFFFFFQKERPNYNCEGRVEPIKRNLCEFPSRESYQIVRYMEKCITYAPKKKRLKILLPLSPICVVNGNFYYSTVHPCACRGGNIVFSPKSLPPTSVGVLNMEYVVRLSRLILA